MTSVQALAVAAAAFVAAGQPWPPRAEARIVFVVAQTEALTHHIVAETSALIHGCDSAAKAQRGYTVSGRLPDGSIHLGSRAARL